MWIYILIYVFVFFLAGISEKCCDENKKIKKIIFWVSTILIIIVPALLAGLRGKNVGTDTSGYVLYAFQFAVDKYNLQQIIKYSNVEPLYAVINLIVATLTNNMNILLFVLQLIVDIVFFVAFYNLRKKHSYALLYSIFIILFFNKSLNMIRQTIAIGFVMLSFKEAVNNKFIKYCLLNIAAICFHKTAIIAFPIYFIIKLAKGQKSRRNITIIIGSSILAILLFRPVVMFLVNLHVLDKRYSQYINFNSDILMLELLFMIAIFSICMIFRKQLLKINNYNKLYMVFLAIAIILYSLGIFNTFASRFSYYYYYFIVFIIEEIIKVISLQKNQRWVEGITISSITLLIVYSSIYYGHYKLDGTVPYKTVYSERKEEILQ